MKKWECTVCGYIHEGEEPPEKCPVCGADRDKFIELKVSEEAANKGAQESETQLAKGAGIIPEKITSLILEKHLHPISVHTPNGIIPVAVIFLLLGVLFQSSGLETAAYLNMIVAFLSMPLVILTGYAAWQKKYAGAKTPLFIIKISASCLVTVILLGLIVWKSLQPDILTTASSGRWLFLLWALILFAAVGLAGHLGGKLVFGKKNKK